MQRLLALIVLLALSACSSSSGGIGGSAGAASTGSAASCTSAKMSEGCFGSCDSCTVLTQAQVAAATGAAVQAGDNSGDPHSCDWVQNDANVIPAVQVVLDANIDAKTFESICHPSGSVSVISVTPVSGVGDDACFVQIQDLGGPRLTFLKGCWAYTLSISGLPAQFPDATSETDQKALAAAALPNL